MINFTAIHGIGLHHRPTGEDLINHHSGGQRPQLLQTNLARRLSPLSLSNNLGKEETPLSHVCFVVGCSCEKDSTRQVVFAPWLLDVIWD